MPFSLCVWCVSVHVAMPICLIGTLSQYFCFFLSSVLFVHLFLKLSIIIFSKPGCLIVLIFLFAVFSYSMVMWELLTRQVPFDHVRIWDVRDLIISGARPPMPKVSATEFPESYLDLMQVCWDAEPARRPRFTAIVAQLQDMLSK